MLRSIVLTKARSIPRSPTEAPISEAPIRGRPSPRAHPETAGVHGEGVARAETMHLPGQAWSRVTARQPRYAAHEAECHSEPASRSRAGRSANRLSCLPYAWPGSELFFGRNGRCETQAWRLSALRHDGAELAPNRALNGCAVTRSRPPLLPSCRPAQRGRNRTRAPRFTARLAWSDNPANGGLSTVRKAVTHE